MGVFKHMVEGGGGGRYGGRRRSSWGAVGLGWGAVGIGRRPAELGPSWGRLLQSHSPPAPYRAIEKIPSRTFFFLNIPWAYNCIIFDF